MNHQTLVCQVCRTECLRSHVLNLPNASDCAVRFAVSIFKPRRYVHWVYWIIYLVNGRMSFYLFVSQKLFDNWSSQATFLLFMKFNFKISYRRCLLYYYTMIDCSRIFDVLFRMCESAVCPDKHQATTKCVVCNEALCADCSLAHQRVTATSSHFLQTVS